MSRVLITERQLLDIIGDPNGYAARQLRKIGAKVERAAKRHAPVDHGRLRSSITTRVDESGDGLAAIIGTDVEYAIHQEFGTRHQRGKPFMRPGLIEGTRA